MRSDTASPDHAPTGRSAPLAALAAIVLWSGALLFAPSSARAGTFVYPMCWPYENTAHQFAFSRNALVFKADVNCGTSGAGIMLWVSGSGTADDKWARWTVTVPSNLHLRSWAAKVHAKNYAKHWARNGTYRTDGQTVYWGGESPGTGYQDRFWDGGTGPWARSLYSEIGCWSGPCGAVGSRRAHIYMRYVKLTLLDSAPPVLDVDGPMLTAGVKSGTQYVDILARDPESGVEKIAISVNGQAVQGSPSASGCLRAYRTASWFRSYRPCPTSLSRSIAVDTERPPFLNGANTIRVCAYDTITPTPGNAANVDCEERVVVVDNTCPSSTPGGSTLSVGFGSARRSSALVGFRRRPILSGRLTSASGYGVAGALICVSSRELWPGQYLRRIAAVRTDAAGNWSLTVPAGPSRAFQTFYRDDTKVERAAASLYVRARPLFRLRPRRLRGGGCVRMRAVLPEPNAREQVITLQGKVRGARHWIEFMTATTGPRRRIKRRYCFGATSRTTIYVLRALVRHQNGYPYARGTSSPRRVKVVVK